MFDLRRLVLAVLLACLPFQSVVGATGIACAFSSHAAKASAGNAAHAASTHDEDAAHDLHASDGHPAPAVDGSGAHDTDTHAAAAHAQASAHDASHATADHAGSDTCRFCMECCAGAAPVPVIDEIRPGPARLFRLPSLTSPVHATHSADVLYRPPRTSAA